MGALTLKSFPFELRGWDIEKLESIDPTDSFGSSTRIYVNKHEIIQIEPEYDIYTSNIWLTDKGRQFFDSIFSILSQNNKFLNLTSSFWDNLTKNILKILYLVDQCKKTKEKNNFFTIIFENLSIEVLSFLLIIAKNYSFINLKRAEDFNINNDLESNFQLNITTNKSKLMTSTVCLLIANNPRYESYLLNLNLKQRLAKGNFKCFSIGSLINLTFPTIFLGSNLNILKDISTGNSLICQNLKNSNRPLIIHNIELLKRKDGQKILNLIKTIKYANLFLKTWNPQNVFSSTLCETGIQSIAKFLPATSKDFQSFGILYFLNVNDNNLTNVKQIIEFKLLNFAKFFKKQLTLDFLIIEQTSIPNKFIKLFNKFYKNTNYYNIPNKTFYENEETFLNVEGLIKRTNKIIFKDKTVNNWQLLRKLFKNCKNNINFIDNKNNFFIFPNFEELIKFKNFTYFHYQATHSLINLNFYLIVKNEPFITNNINFKTKNKKIFLTKLKYWLDDFYTGGKDEYSKYSFNMINCSKILRVKLTNFF